MQKISALVLNGVIKVIFVFVPITAAVYFGCWLCGELLIAHGLRRVLFVPGLVAFMTLIWLAKKMFGATLDEINRLHSQRSSNS